MKMAFPILVILLLATSGVFAQAKKSIAWKSWSQLELALHQEPRPVLLFLHATWCAYCKKIEREVFTKETVIDKINADYYAVEMDVETLDTIVFDGQEFVNKQALTQRNGVHEIPLLLASREGQPFSLPSTIILNEEFEVEERVFEYYTSRRLLNML